MRRFDRGDAAMTGFLVGAISGAVLFMASIPVPAQIDKDWQCTESVRINDEKPEKYECVQYSKKELEK
jgi:hypothetical protein